MNGSIRKKNKNSWEITIDLGHDENGKRKRKYVHVTGTKADAQRHQRELLTNLDKGLLIDIPKTSLGEFIDRWLRDYVEIRVSPRTAEGYHGIIRRYIRPNLGRVDISRLTPQHVQKLYSDMLKKGLSATTVLHTHRLLSEILGHAVKWGVIIRNVCDAVDPPRPQRREMTALDSTQAQKLLEATAQSPYGAIFFLALYAGLRRSEILGLRWCDVDIPNKTISVNQTLHRLIGKGLVIGEPKTSHSRRAVKLPPDAVALLAGLRAKRRDQLEVLGIGWRESDFVFCDAHDRPMAPDTVSHNFSKIMKRLGFSRVRFHDLRHTHATLMLKQGVHPKIVSERLGHATVNITLDTYSHVLPGMQDAAVIAFEEAMKPRELIEVMIQKDVG